MKTSLVCVLLFGLLPFLRADDALFVGNSFTEANHLTKLVEDVAASKGRKLETGAHTRGGMGWSFHLSGTGINDQLKSKSWNWVVLQDYSTNATHINQSDRGGFEKTGEEFYDRIAQFAPQAAIVLYETWAYDGKSAIYKGAAPASDAEKNAEGKPEEKKGGKAHSPQAEFANPDEMMGEIQKSFTTLQATLQAKDAKRQVLIAPVGEAFAKCVHEHPEINIYSKDRKHPDLQGSYLAACVIYATCYHDSPVGAAPAPTLKADEAKTLQEIAEAVTAKK